MDFFPVHIDCTGIIHSTEIKIDIAFAEPVGRNIDTCGIPGKSVVIFCKGPEFFRNIFVMQKKKSEKVLTYLLIPVKMAKTVLLTL